MNSELFRVLQIDHVELFVPDRQAAAAWYESVLGLISVPEAVQWAKDPEGPLMISPGHGKNDAGTFPRNSSGRAIQLKSNTL
jgi:catechol 2,3-dioxygenase-like lactoylglutathione lyase family enzyme